MKFMNHLSPAHITKSVAIWVANRTDYSVDDLVKALKKFTKFLESASYANHTVLSSHRLNPSVLETPPCSVRKKTPVNECIGADYSLLFFPADVY